MARSSGSQSHSQVVLGGAPRQIQVPEVLVKTLQDVFNLLVELLWILGLIFLVLLFFKCAWDSIVRPQLQAFFSPALGLLESINDRLGLLVSNSFY